MSASLAQARTAHERDSAAHVRETAAALEAALRDKTAAVEKVRSELTEELSRTKAEMGAGVSELRNALEKITAQCVSVRRRALTPPSAASPPAPYSLSPSLSLPLSPSCLPAFLPSPAFPCLPSRPAASESVRPRAQQARPRGTLLTHTRRALVVRSRPSDVRIPAGGGEGWARRQATRVGAIGHEPQAAAARLHGWHDEPARSWGGKQARGGRRQGVGVAAGLVAIFVRAEAAVPGLSSGGVPALRPSDSVACGRGREPALKRRTGAGMWQRHGCCGRRAFTWAHHVWKGAPVERALRVGGFMSVPWGRVVWKRARGGGVEREIG